MTSSTINEPDNPIERPATEEELRAEIERLKRQLDKKGHAAHSPLENPKRPSGGKILMLLLLVGAIFVVAFFVGYIPVPFQPVRDCGDGLVAIVRIDIFQQRANLLTRDGRSIGRRLHLPELRVGCARK